jgi:hypothetical protein
MVGRPLMLRAVDIIEEYKAVYLAYHGKPVQVAAVPGGYVIEDGGPRTRYTLRKLQAMAACLRAMAKQGGER